MNFNEAENYLLSLGNEVVTMKLGLENVSKLFAKLGDPQKNYLKVQVAGTNGKGSVCAFLNSICVTAGIRTGMYTSPHLISITERVQIDGAPITEDDFARLATRVREASEALVDRGELESVPTFFEQLTAIALLAFADAKVELAILETGLGGRLDATTAANAEIAAITRIDIDHQQYLGDTIEEIAAEKAAIIHSGIEVVVGKQVFRALRVILQHCQEVGVVPILSDVELMDPDMSANDRLGDFKVRYAEFVPLGFLDTELGLAGFHQVENALVANALANVLRERFQISADQILRGFETARHPGRLESIGRFLLDGAHNPGGARSLRDHLDYVVKDPVTIIFGAMNDKDVTEIAKILFPRANRLILTKPTNSRAMSMDVLLDAIPDGTDRKNVFTADSVAAALQVAEEVSEPGDAILITGSLYLVGEARKILASEISDR